MPEAKVNPFGVAAFIFGILALLICWIPLLNLLVVPLAGIGALLAIAGITTAVAGRRSGLGWPLTGLVLCLGACFVAVAMYAGAAAVVSDVAQRQRTALARRPAIDPPVFPVVAPELPPQKATSVPPVTSGAPIEEKPVPSPVLTRRPVQRPTASIPNPGFDEPAYRYFPVPRVKPGSTLYAYVQGREDVPVSTDLFAHLDLQKSLLADDKPGIRELIRSGRLLAVPNGTAVNVLQFDNNAAEVPSYEVRILEGEHEGRKGWVAASWLWGRTEVRVIAKKAPSVATKAPAEDSDRTADRHRDSLMRMGRALEKSNPKAALENYREVVKGFPDTPEAKAAAERIKALEK